MESATPDLGKTLTAVLDLTPVDGTLPLPVREGLTRELRSPAHRATAATKATALVAELKNELAKAAWFHGKWVSEISRTGRAQL